MSRYRYSTACKVQAVQRVVEDGHSAYDVAREAGVSASSLFFWVRRYRQLAQPSRQPGQAGAPARAAQVAPHDVGTLVAYLRRGHAG
jgi:transposase-like protein